MKVKVILHNDGGEIASEQIDMPGADCASERLSHAIHDVIDAWILSPGDSIKIVEV